MNRLRGDDKKIILLALVAVVLRFVPLFFSMESNDIIYYRHQAMLLENGRNLYSAPDSFFVYTPVSMFYPALCGAVAKILALPFHVVIKIPAILADIGIVFALYCLGWRLMEEKKAWGIAMLYALNPVSILIVSFHGNNMSITVLTLLMAYLYLLIDKERNVRQCALLLGLSIGWRTFPALLFPFFLSKIDKAEKKMVFTAYCLAPVFIATIPFLLLDPASMCKKILGYSGLGINHGPFAVVLADYLIAHRKITWISADACYFFNLLSTAAFLGSYWYLFISLKTRSLLHNILLVFLSFYIFYTAVASQYLIWVLPFLLLLTNRKVFFLYTGVTFYALVIFYWGFYPDILFGNLPWLSIKLTGFFNQYRISQFLLSSVWIWVSVELLLNKTRPLPDLLQKEECGEAVP